MAPEHWNHGEHGEGDVHGDVDGSALAERRNIDRRPSSDRNNSTRCPWPDSGRRWRRIGRSAESVLWVLVVVDTAGDALLSEVVSFGTPGLQ